ncbi:MAG TPA: NUDIX domain-containing protein [Trueperaceae bacterium]
MKGTRGPANNPPQGAVPGAGGVVFNDQGEVLLLHHAGGHWVFPKGHIDPGETPLETALREVEEESGVAATCPDPNARQTTSYRNNRGEERVITWYLLYAENARIVLREALFPEGGFFAPADALERLAFEEDRALLKAMLARQENASR